MTFIPNPGFGDDLLRSDELAGMLGDLADKAAAAARGIAPERLGKYRDSIISGVTSNDEGITVGRVAATDFKAVWIEKGTGAPKPTPAFHPLRSGVESAVGHVS